MVDTNDHIFIRTFSESQNIITTIQSNNSGKNLLICKSKTENGIDRIKTVSHFYSYSHSIKAKLRNNELTTELEGYIPVRDFSVRRQVDKTNFFGYALSILTFLEDVNNSGFSISNIQSDYILFNSLYEKTIIGNIADCFTIKSDFSKIQPSLAKCYFEFLSFDQGGDDFSVRDIFAYSNKNIQTILFNLILHLKEQKYTSVKYLKKDIEDIRDLFLNKTTITDYTLNQNGLIRKKNSENLIGKKEIYESIIDIINNEINERESFSIGIYSESGLGKTFLLDKINKYLDNYSRQYTLRCNFCDIDFYNVNYLYSSLLNEFIEKVLTEDQNVIEFWKQSLKEIFLLSDKSFFDSIPHLSLLLEDDYLFSRKITQDVFFIEFFKIVSSKSKGVTICVDNIDLCNTTNLQYLYSIACNPSLNGIRVIYTYSNSIEFQNPLNNELIKNSVFQINNLNKNGVDEYISGNFADITEYNIDKYQFSSFHQIDLIIDKKIDYQVVFNSDVIDFDQLFVKLNNDTLKFLKLISVFGSRLDFEKFNFDVIGYSNIQLHDIVEELVVFNIIDYTNKAKRSVFFKNSFLRKKILDSISTNEKCASLRIFLDVLLNKNDILAIDTKAQLDSLHKNEVEAFLDVLYNSKELLLLNHFYNHFTKLIIKDEKEKVSFEESKILWKLKKEALENKPVDRRELLSILYSERMNTVNKNKFFNSFFENWDNQKNKVFKHEILTFLLKENNFYLPDKISGFLKVKNFVSLINYIYKPQNYYLSNPISENEDFIQFSRLIFTAAENAYFINPDLLPYFLKKQLDLTISRGTTVYSLSAFSSIVFILSLKLKKYKDALKYIEICEILLEYKSFQFFESRIRFIIGMSSQWSLPYYKSLQEFDKSFQSGIKYKDYTFASYALLIKSQYKFIFGGNLLELKNELSLDLKKITFYGQKEVIYYSVFFESFINSISSRNTKDWLNDYSGKLDRQNVSLLHMFDCFEYLQSFLNEELIHESNNMSFIYKKEYDNINSPFSPLLIVVNQVFTLKTYQNKNKFKGQIRKTLRLLKSWKNLCAYNFEAQYYLIKGIYYFLNNNKKANNYIDYAIEIANERDFKFIECLSWEVAAHIHLKFGNNVLANMYYEKTEYNYKNWGASKKADNIALEYKMNSKNTDVFSNRNLLSKNGFKDFDFKHTQYINSIIHENEFNDSFFLKLSVKLKELTNSQTVKVFLREKNQMNFVYHLDSENIFENYRLKQFQKDNFPIKLIEKICFNKEAILTYNITKQSNVLKESYFNDQKTKSVLGLPLISQKEILGVLLFENSEDNIFNESISNYLQIFTSQIASLYKNKILKENLEEEIEHRTAELKAKNKSLKFKNKQIKSSIDYAKSIQFNTLPQISKIKDSFSEWFVFFKPRDVVSGDYYWYGEVDNKQIIAVLDCTGHGVPGAFMSLISNTLLNSIVKEMKVINPPDILEIMNRKIQETLNQKDLLSVDGVEMSIVTIDKSENRLSFSGAHLPLLIIDNNVPTLIKGDKFSIGGTDNVVGVFTKHEIELNDNQKFYLFTDGYQDQIGGPRNKKFMSKRFYKLLENSCHLDDKEQHNFIKTEFDNWKNGNEGDQLDDVLVIGFKH